MANPEVRLALKSLDDALALAHAVHVYLPKSHIRPRAMIVNAEDLIAEAWKELRRGSARTRRSARRSEKKQSAEPK